MGQNGGLVTGELKSQVDRVWDAFWSGGISNPMDVAPTGPNAIFSAGQVERMVAILRDIRVNATTAA
jgi:hypothetical protein